MTCPFVPLVHTPTVATAFLGGLRTTGRESSTKARVDVLRLMIQFKSSLLKPSTATLIDGPRCQAARSKPAPVEQARACRFRESFRARPGLSSRKGTNMKKNVGSLERVMRGLMSMAMIVGAFVAAAHVEIRLGLGIMGVYVGFTALAGTCVGYRLMGLSTCPTEHR
jgi:hypothetical protein